LAGFASPGLLATSGAIDAASHLTGNGPAIEDVHNSFQNYASNGNMPLGQKVKNVANTAGMVAENPVSAGRAIVDKFRTGWAQQSARRQQYDQQYQQRLKEFGGPGGSMAR
jgi:hypothetical protein